jgi:hypothetical protein
MAGLESASIEYRVVEKDGDHGKVVRLACVPGVVLEVIEHRVNDPFRRVAF